MFSKHFHPIFLAVTHWWLLSESIIIIVVANVDLKKKHNSIILFIIYLKKKAFPSHTICLFVTIRTNLWVFFFFVPSIITKHYHFSFRSSNCPGLAKLPSVILTRFPHFLSTFLLIAITRCSRLILYSPHFIPEISPFSKKPSILLVRKDF